MHFERGLNTNTLVQANDGGYDSRVTILRATNSFLRRLLAGKQGTAVSNPSLTPGPHETVVPEPSIGEKIWAHRHKGGLPPRLKEIVEGSASPRIPSLYAFVDLKDPFAAGGIAGEELPGPILSIMSALPMSCLYLFHTPHTRNRADLTRQRFWKDTRSAWFGFGKFPLPIPRTTRR